MNDRGGYLNGSGYPDPTAYRAIKRMEDKSMNVNRGEIWKYMAGENEREGIVVGYDNVTVAVYPLLDIDLGGCIEIVSRAGIKYIHPLRMAYTTGKKLIEYVQDVPSDTMGYIDSAMCADLGLSVNTEESERSEPAHSSEEYEDALNDIARLKLENQQIKESLIEYTVKSRVMTEQYNALLDRLCKNNCCC